MSVPYEAAQQLAQLSGLVLSIPDLQGALTEVTRVATAVVPGCRGTSVTMHEQGRPTVSAADDEWSGTLDRLQVEEQEGPCLDCLREGSVMRVKDLADDGRFPNYGPRAVACGARSTLSVPLSADGRTVGALNLYATEPDVFDTEAVALGTVLAAHASLALQAANAYFSSRDLALQLQDAMANRAEIEQAKGILMRDHGCGPEDAFRRLVDLSQRENRKLRDVARDLVASVTAG